MSHIYGFARTNIRRFIYRALFWIGEKGFGMRKRSVILCYHSIADDDWFHAVPNEDFMSQVRLLKERGYHFLSLTELVRSLRDKRELPDPYCVITFDDGYRDVLSVKDFLKQESIHPALFVLAEPQRVNRAMLGTDRPFLTKDEIKGLTDGGWDIGCHGARHQDLGRADREILQHEIIHSRERLRKELGLPIDFFAFPFGAYAYQALAYVRRGGYKAALSMDDKLSITPQSIWKLPRIGINRTYSLAEFEAALSPLSITFRRLVKMWGL